MIVQQHARSAERQPDASAQRSIVPALPTLIFGGDYNPEQWPEEVWAEDARLMQEAGVNLVSLGVFAWARIEPRPGVYDFGWLDRVIDLLHDHGVAINLATPTASPPPWLVRMHPELLPVTSEGVRLGPGSRRHYCPNSPAYRRHAARIAAALAERYGNHPALALWHIDNEYACHVAECFCEQCAAAFRAWLQARHTSLDAVNESWGTAFWGQIYGEWEEIQPPRRAPYMIHPGHLLDWRRFCSDSWLACFEEQRAILKAATPHVPVTTNFLGFFQPIDYWKWAAREDLVANDSYPDPADPFAAADMAMQCDLMRSLGGGRPWVLMEQVTSHVNWRPQNSTKAPGQMRLGSYQALARGADGVMFFQWRASRAGGEQFHGAMLPHAGTDSRVWREVVGLGAELKALAPLAGSRVQAEAAILLDWESWWALESPGKPSGDVRLLDELRRWYAALYGRNVTVDFVHPEAPLSGYKLLLAPNLYLVSDRAAQNIEAFVESGGVLLLGCFSGITDLHAQVRLGGYPAPWRALLGLRIEEFAPLPPHGRGMVVTADEEEFDCATWVEVIQLAGGEALACFADGFYAGRPALTRHRFGEGAAYYSATRLDEAGLGWLIGQACKAASLAQPRLACAGVELLQRRLGGQHWVFALNHDSTPSPLPVETHEYDLLGAPVIDGVVTLAPYGIAILTRTST